MYRFVWTEPATRGFLDQCATAGREVQASAITATLEIDAILTDQPFRAGESREPGTRVLIVNPVTVTFHINDARREVSIASVRVHWPRDT